MKTAFFSCFKTVLALGFLLLGQWSWGQTNPDTGTLPYGFNGAVSLPNTIAVHRFGTTAANIPTSRITFDGNGDLPSTTTNNSGGYMIEGTNGADGLSMLASGAQAAGAIVVEISTMGKENITVSYVAWTKLNQTSRDNSIALQYRIGDNGTWVNIDNPVSSVYSTGSEGRSNGVSFNQTLPTDANNKPIVQVRWIYWESSDSSGSRDRLGIDNIFIDGTTVSSCTAPTTQPSIFTSTGITAYTATIGWTGSGDNVLVVARAGGAVNAAPTNGTAYTDNAVLGWGTQIGTGNYVVYKGTGNTVNISGLSVSTAYYFALYKFNAADNCYNLAAPLTGNLTTLSLSPGTLPFTENFEGPANWTYSNDSQSNKWFVGTATNYGGTNALYISDNNGVANQYATGSTSVTHAYRDINIPAGTTTVSFAFDWRANGEGFSTHFYDYFRVWLVPNTFIPTAGIQITTGTDRLQVGGHFNNQPNYISYSNNIDIGSFAGQTMRLVYEWNNDSSIGNQPPAAIDNVKISIPAPCVAPVSQPTALSFSAITQNSISGAFTGASAEKYLVVVSTSDLLSGNPVNGTAYTAGQALGGGTVVSASALTSFTVNGLTAITPYHFFVFAYNDASCTGGPAYNSTSPLQGSEITLAAPVPKTYTLVTDVSQLEAGKKYLIVNSGNATSNARAVGSQNDNNRAQSDQLTIVNSGGNMTITTLVADSNSSTAPFEFLLGGSPGAWTIQDVVNTGLLYPVSGQNYLRNATGGTNNYNWTVSIAGTAVAAIATTTNNRTIQYNSSATVFSAYTTNQGDVYLYKEGAPAPVAPYYRSQATGNWSDVATWQSSTDNVAWATATAVPTQSATSILIRNGHTVSIAGSGVSMKGVTIESGGVLEHAAQVDWTLGGTGIQLTVNSGGVLLVNFPGPSPAGVKINGSGEALVKTGGKVQVGPVIEDGSLAGDLYLRTNSKFTYEHDAIFEWSNGNRVLGTTGSGVNFFKTNNSTALPILRISVKPGFPYGSSSNNIFNAILEVNAELSFQGNGVKAFKGGIRGTGTVYQPMGTLEFPSTPGITPVLGGSVTINTISSGIRLMNGATVPVGANVTIKSDASNAVVNKEAGSLLVDGTLDLSEMRMVNTSGDVTVNGTLRTAHSGGLYGTGSAIPSGCLVINTGSTVDYNRNGDQIISNPSLSGITGSSTVTEGAATNTAYYHVLFSGSGTKSGNSYTRVHQNGSVKITGTPTVNFSGSNLGLNAGNTTDFIMEGGRLILGSGGTQPNMNGQYSLSGGVIEFTGTSAVQIRTGVSPKQYLNIEVSGTNVTAGTTDDSGLTFQSGGTFTVKNEGVFKVPNTAGFTGTAASAIKNIAVLSAINLETGSTVEYKRAGDQVITAQVNVGQGAEGNYAKLKISGSGIKSPEAHLTVKENIVVESGELRIKSTTDNLTNTDNHLPNVLWAHQGIQNTGGTVTLGNNAQLMQDATGVTNTGNVVVERDTRIPASGTAQYVYWSSPVVPSSAASGTFFKTIFPGHTTQPLYYNETNDYFYNSTGAYIQGRGLAVKNPVTSGSPASLTAKLTGTPFNGDASFTMTMNGRGFNLVGNPYPSNISLQELYTLNGGDPAVETEDGKIASTFHLWDNSFNVDNTQEGSGYGGASYATYNAKGSGTGNPANSSSKDPNGGIASIAQGFMVKAIKATDKTLIFNNTVREPMKSIFFKGGNPDAGKFWIRMTTPRNQFCTTAITYSKGATDSFDSFDSRINSNSSDLLYSLADDQKLAIQGRAFEFSASDILPLGSSSFEAGVHTIHLWKKEGIFNGQQQIYLKDKQIGALTNLSEGSYTFMANAGETTGRFEIVYKEGSVLATDSETVNGFSVYLYGTNFVARSDSKILLNAQLYDSGGRLLADAPGRNQTQILFRADHLAHGMYVIKAQMKDGNTVTKKIRK